MDATAFCPAHITGFFTARNIGSQISERCGSTGAGFSIKEGVTTHVKVVPKLLHGDNFQITVNGHQTDNMDVSKFVLDKFLSKAKFEGLFVNIHHSIAVPVGYGLGSSGAVALSLAYALDEALGTKLGKVEAGKIAHNAEVSCKTGLGDVLASYHGGFEIRLKPGAPGIGKIEKIDAGPISIIIICFSPISTNKFIKEHLSKINGLGEKMVGGLLETKNYEDFQDMSLEFAKYVGVMTPKMNKVVKVLESHHIKCGVALFGETLFSMVPKEKEKRALEILGQFTDGKLIRSSLDGLGARLLYN